MHLIGENFNKINNIKIDRLITWLVPKILTSLAKILRDLLLVTKMHPVPAVTTLVG